MWKRRRFAAKPSDINLKEIKEEQQTVRLKSVFHRTAARGIVQRGNLYLFVTNKFGDYKSPGGGVEPGETLEATLCREMPEKTGYAVLKGSLREYGLVNERRKGITADILEMDSHYFFCEVQKKNRQIAEEKRNPWVLREIGVEECLLEGN